MTIFEKASGLFNKKYCSEKNEVLYKSKLIKPFSIGRRCIELYDKCGILIGKVLEDDSIAERHNQTHFFRRFYVNDKELAILEGSSFRTGLTLKNIPWQLQGNISSLNYSVIDNTGTNIFSYMHNWIKGGTIVINIEDKIILCLLIALAIAMDCNTESERQS